MTTIDRPDEQAMVDDLRSRISALEEALRDGVGAVEKYVAVSEGRLVGPDGDGRSTRLADRARRGLESATRDAELFLDRARALLPVGTPHPTVHEQAKK